MVSSVHCMDSDAFLAVSEKSSLHERESMALSLIAKINVWIALE